eukprot:TsM_001182000 transcript=TsM_001182000 gene=TsM_001182000
MPTDSSSPSASQSLFPTAISTASCITSPPLPPRRPPPLASHLRRRNFPPLSNSQASLAEENAKLRLMTRFLTTTYSRAAERTATLVNVHLLDFIQLHTIQLEDVQGKRPRENQS